MEELKKRIQETAERIAHEDHYHPSLKAGV